MVRAGEGERAGKTFNVQRSTSNVQHSTFNAPIPKPVSHRGAETQRSVIDPTDFESDLRASAPPRETVRRLWVEEHITFVGAAFMRWLGVERWTLNVECSG
jgi:hypothetical protein